MSEPYIGEIRLVGFSFAPVNFALCNGAILSIAENDTLFSLIGTTYGGDGVNTFALPDLQGRVPVHQGTQGAFGTSVIGARNGVENVTLNITQIPSHTHSFVVQPALGTLGTPTGNYMAGSSDGQYSPSGGAQTGPILAIAGSSQPHNNVQPYQAINYVIALYGVYPSQ
ncbi:MAG: tail fiber protein [Acidobacteriota bacterium]